MGFLIEISLAGVAALFAWRLSRKARFSEQVSVWLWASALAMLGGGVLIGAFHRQLVFLLPHTTGDVLLRIGLALQLLANALLLAGVVFAYCAGRIRIGALIAVSAKFALFLTYLGYKPAFDVVIYDTAFTTLPLLALCTYGAWTWKYPNAQWIVAGAFVWLFGTLLHQGRVMPGQLFTPDDLFHAVQIVVLCLFVRGGWGMRDEPTSTSSRIAFKRISWR